MLLKIVLPSTRSCGTKNRDVKGGVMEGAPMSPPAACVFIDRLRKTFAGTKSALAIG